VNVTALPIGTLSLLSVNDGVATAGSLFWLRLQPAATPMIKTPTGSSNLIRLLIGKRERDTTRRNIRTAGW
jgi:hypothetical protein